MEELYNGIVAKIQEAIDMKKDHVGIHFEDFPTLWKLSVYYRKEVDRLYNRIRSYFFDRNIGLMFGGYNPGSSVSIFYLDGSLEKYRKDHGSSEDMNKFDNAVRTLYNYYRALAIAPDEGTEYPSLFMDGYLFPFLHYQVSKKLEAIGYRLKLDISGSYYLISV